MALQSVSLTTVVEIKARREHRHFFLCFSPHFTPRSRGGGGVAHLCLCHCRPCWKSGLDVNKASLGFS